MDIENKQLKISIKKYWRYKHKANKLQPLRIAYRVSEKAKKYQKMEWKKQNNNIKFPDAAR